MQQEKIQQMSLIAQTWALISQGLHSEPANPLQLHHPDYVRKFCNRVGMSYEEFVREVSNKDTEHRYPMKGVKGAAQQPACLSSKSRRNWDRVESTIHCSARMDPSLCGIALICHPLSLYSSIPL
jgi:hypothetical protein